MLLMCLPCAPPHPQPAQTTGPQAWLSAHRTDYAFRSRKEGGKVSQEPWHHLALPCSTCVTVELAGHRGRVEELGRRVLLTSQGVGREVRRTSKFRYTLSSSKMVPVNCGATGFSYLTFVQPQCTESITLENPSPFALCSLRDVSVAGK